MTILTVARPANKDILSMLLEDKRSENTRQAYRRDVENFFLSLGYPATPETIQEFLSLTREEAIHAVLQHKADLIHRELAEATVNRRLAAIKALAKFGRKVGFCSWDLNDVEGEKVQSYRDVSGVSVDQVGAMLSIPDRGTMKGKRDYAIMRLLWENALRRGEIVSCNIEDFCSDSRTLAIIGKGRGKQKEIINLSEKAAQAVTEWLNSRGDSLDPLFIALDNCHRGHRMTGKAVAHVVKCIAKKAGIGKVMSPHRMRHSSITAALQATNGNVSKVQKLSRHSKVETLMIYEDNRENMQKEMTELLSVIA